MEQIGFVCLLVFFFFFFKHNQTESYVIFIFSLDVFLTKDSTMNIW